MQLKLLEIAQKQPNIDDHSASLVLYNKKPHPAFTQLKRRLLDDILTVMTLETGSSIFTAKQLQAKKEIQTLVINADILFARGLEAIGSKMLKRALKLAQKFDLTYEELGVQNIMYTTTRNKKGVREYLRLKGERHNVLELLKKKFEAVDSYNDVMIPNLFEKNREHEYLLQAQESVVDIESLLEQTDSREIRGLYLRAGTYLGHLQKDYKKAKKYAEDFLEYVLVDEIVNSSSNIGGAYMQLSMLELYSGSIDDCVRNAEESLNYFKSNTSNELVSLNILFIANSLRENISELENIKDRVVKNRTYTNNQLLQEMWGLKFCLLDFLERNYDSALSYLQTRKALLSDKSGWRIGYLFLEIMCMFELEYYEALEYRIGSLKRIVRAMDEKSSARPEVVLKLSEDLLSKPGYVSPDYLEKLSNDERCSWDPFGYEVFPFDKWLKIHLADNRKRAV